MTEFLKLSFEQREALGGCGGFRQALQASQDQREEKRYPDGSLVLIGPMVKCSQCCMGVRSEIDGSALTRNDGGEDTVENFYLVPVNKAECLKK